MDITATFPIIIELPLRLDDTGSIRIGNTRVLLDTVEPGCPWPSRSASTGIVPFEFRRRCVAARAHRRLVFG